MSSANHCTYTNIFTLPSTSHCQFISDNCPYEYISFYKMHFCLFNSNYLLTIPTTCLLLIIFFFILSETSEHNLSKSLTFLVNKLHISQNIAAVTLLAFGNGAADVISSLVASTQNEGIELAMGSLLGSCSFVTSGALGIIIIGAGANGVKVNASALHRDVALFLISLLFFLIVFIQGKITLYHSAVFIMLYVVNVFMAIYQDWNSADGGKEKRSALVKKDSSNGIGMMTYSKSAIGLGGNDDESSNNEGECKGGFDYNTDQPNDYCYDDDEDDNDGMKNDVNSVGRMMNTIDGKESNSNNNNNGGITSDDNDCCDDIAITISNTNSKENTLTTVTDDKEDTTVNINDKPKENQLLVKTDSNESKTAKHITNPFDYLLYSIRLHYLKHKEHDWESIRLINKIFYLLIDLPFEFLRSITIPSHDIKHWNHLKFAMMPISTFLFIILVFKLFNHLLINPFIYTTILITCILLSLFLYITTKEKTLPRTVIPIAFLSFTMSLIWIWFIASNLISLLKVMGLLLGLLDSYLGMTLLTFGNSICDIALNVALVKNGYAEMAVTGALSGPLFNLLVGLGVTLLKENLMSGSISVDVRNLDSAIVIVAIIGMMANLIRLVIQAKIGRYRLNRSVAYTGFGVYVGVFIGVTYVAFGL